jgi:hypothetical protein
MDRTEIDTQKNSSIVVCILCCGNVITEPLPSSDTGIQIQILGLKGGITENTRGLNLAVAKLTTVQVTKQPYHKIR